MRPEIKKQIQENIEGKSLAGVAKEIRRETRKKVKLEKEAGKQRGVDKMETEKYINTINSKILLLLEGITLEKINSAPLASLSKAFRSLLGQLPSIPENREPEKHVNLNIDLGKLSQEEILKMLSEKSNTKNE